MPRTVSISVRFILRKNKAKPDAICPIEAVIYKNTVGYRYAIGIGAKVTDWDDTKDRFSLFGKLTAIDKRERAALNDILDKWEVELKELWRELNVPNFSGLPKDPLTPTAWILAVDRKLGKGKAASKVPAFTEHVKAEIEKEIKAWQTATSKTDWRKNNTLQTKFTFYKLILLYQKQNGKIEWSSINAQTVQAFQAWLFKPCEGTISISLADVNQTRLLQKIAYNDGSAKTHLVFLKYYISTGVAKKYAATDVLGEAKTVRAKAGKPDKFYYYWREVEKILTADLSGHKKAHKLHQARLLMCIGFFTGMREGDWEKLNEKFIHNNYLNVITDKVGTRVSVPLFGVLKKILAITGFDFGGFASNSMLNSYIKALTKEAGIDRVVMVGNTTGGAKQTSNSVPLWQKASSHFCRRSFAHMLLKYGIDFDNVRLILGHSEQKQTADYVADKTFADAAFNNESEKEALKAFLHGDVDLSNFAKDHENYLRKLA